MDKEWKATTPSSSWNAARRTLPETLLQRDTRTSPNHVEVLLSRPSRPYGSIHVKTNSQWAHLVQKSAPHKSASWRGIQSQLEWHRVKIYSTGADLLRLRAAACAVLMERPHIALDFVVWSQLEFLGHDRFPPLANRCAFEPAARLSGSHAPPAIFSEYVVPEIESDSSTEMQLCEVRCWWLQPCKPQTVALGPDRDFAPTSLTVQVKGSD